MKIQLAVTSLLLWVGSAFSLTVHLYSPWKDDPKRNASPAFIEITGSGGPTDPIPFRGKEMVSEGGDWFVATIDTSAKGYMDFQFSNYIPDPNNKYAAIDAYLNGTKRFTMDDVFYTNHYTEVWIYPQGPGQPPYITDRPPAKKVLYLFTPWAIGSPAIKTAKTDFKNMRFPVDKSRCGWYMHYFTDTSYVVTFKNTISGETYGTGGLKDAKAYDLTALFQTADTVFLVPQPLPGGPAQIMTAFPEGTLGTCTFNLGVTIRDFSTKNPDFDHAAGFPDKVTKNMVMPTLGADNKPMQGPVKYLQSHFSSWFNTDSTNADVTLRNYQSCYDLPMSKTVDGYWSYSSLESPSGSFFPIDGAADHNPTEEMKNCVDKDYIGGACNFSLGDNQLHNFSFCMEMHANFKYEKGQKFTFIGDDDVWVFINKKLAVDLGGTHSPAKDSVALDTMSLTAGSQYPFDLFYCERQHNGSNLFVKTSIYFEQLQAVFANETVTGTSHQYDILERTSGGKGCDADTNGTVAAATVTFKLSGPNIAPPEALPVGASHGGIVINGTRNQITIDTSKIVGLKPGVYTINFVSDKTGKGGSLQFTISGSETFEFFPKTAINTLKGTPVPVTVRTLLNGKFEARADNFKLSPLTGLVMFEDSAMTKPITATTDLSTDATSGTKTIWVTSQTAGVYKLDVIGSAKGALTDTYSGITFNDRPKVAKPVAAPPGQDFSSLSAGLTVTLSDATAGADIYYTLDGTAPDSVERGTTKHYTAAISVTATTTIKAIAVKAGSTTSDVMSETYNRVVPPKAGTPTANPPGKNFLSTLPVTLATTTAGATILYTLDGTTPAAVKGGSTLEYNGSFILNATTTIKAIAVKSDLLPSDVMTESYTFTPPAVVKSAWYEDKDGDGMIETVVINYDKDLGALPDKLTFKISAPPMADEERTADKSKNEIAASPNSKAGVIVTLSNPFPYGMTSMSNASTSGLQYLQESIPLVDGAFAVGDSVAPVIAKTDVQPGDSAQPYTRVIITFSEYVKMPSLSQTAVVFKRDNDEMGPADIRISAIKKITDVQYEFDIDSSSAKFPIVGDSVAINNNGEIVDAGTIAPSRKLFRVLDGIIPKPKPTAVYVSFQNGTNKATLSSQPNEPTTPNDVIFIPFGRNDIGLQGSPDEGKCPGCFVGQEQNFVGPVIYLETPGAVDWEFKIFSNLGEFVAGGKGKITDQDLASLGTIKNGSQYLVRIVWTGQTFKGNKAGTGAYVLTSILRLPKNLKTGAAPTTEKKSLVFGLLRDFTAN